jgi:hypothetical protein
VFDERAAEGIRDRARHGRPVALDDDVEIAARRGPSPRVAHEAPDDEGARALCRGDSRDVGQQHTSGGRQRVFQSASNGERARERWTRDRTATGNDDGRRALAQGASHHELGRAHGDDRQRARDGTRGHIIEAEHVGAREIVDEDVRRTTGEHASAAAACESERIRGGDARRRRDHIGVDEVAGREHDLRIGVSATGHRGHHRRRVERRCGLRETPPRCLRGPRAAPAPMVI